MTTTALARNPITVDEWGLLLTMAQSISESHLFPSAGTPSAAAALMLTARDLGISVAAALQGLQVIQGQVTIKPALAWGIVTASGLLESWSIDDQVDKDGNAVACVVTLKRLHGNSFTVKYTMEDAKRAGLIKAGSGWVSFPSNMCRWRAVGFCIDVLFPDLILGFKRSDEPGATVDQGGNVIEGEAVPV